MRLPRAIEGRFGGRRRAAEDALQFRSLFLSVDGATTSADDDEKKFISLSKTLTLREAVVASVLAPPRREEGSAPCRREGARRTRGRRVESIFSFLFGF